MNNVLYHLHPVKVKRHAVKVSYTYCLGGLSFFLFILLTVTGIFLMFFYPPTADQAWDDIATCRRRSPSATAGAQHAPMGGAPDGAHRVPAHGPGLLPRRLQAAAGVQLGDRRDPALLTLLLSFTGYLLPWDQLALWAVTVGTNMMGFTPVFGDQVQFVLLGGVEIGPTPCCAGTCCTCCSLPFVIVIFLAVHFWRVRKDGGISGPLYVLGSTRA
jgi:quinol-cytochrome oxidoreductase complex cytochrome b subunit